MNEERKMILQMVQDGAVTAEEAERLLDALPSEPAGITVAPVLDGGVRLMPKRIHVQVTENGRNKVNIRIPFSLVRTGLKLGQSLGAFGKKNTQDQEAAQALEMLQDIDIDEIISSLSDGAISLPYTIVDVDEEENGEQVHVVLE